MAKKYKFEVWNSAEDISTGYVILTMEQAKAVAYACNEDNWIDAKLNNYSGSFGIDIDNPIPVEG